MQWTYVGWEGSQWRYGVGLQIASPTQIRIFGCDEDPDGDRDNYEFPILGIAEPPMAPPN